MSAASPRPAPARSEPAAPADEAFVECDHHGLAKHGEHLPGDVWLTRRVAEEDRVVCVLSDGLGSGVKANVLATLTATMAVRYSADRRDVRHGAAIIRRTLPVCSVRGISYSTFSIVDVDGDRLARIAVYGNPPLLLMRGGKASTVQAEEAEPGEGPGRELRTAEVSLAEGDRLVVVSDGITQAGMGGRAAPYGWGAEGLAAFVEGRLARAPYCSARDLSRRVVERARELDGGSIRDDATCGVVYVRRPRRLLLITGAPYDPDQDAALAEEAIAFPGRRVICGGTTAEIIARELGTRVEPERGPLDPEVPPTSEVDGFDLVTEGMITLSRALGLLEAGRPPPPRRNGARRLLELLLDSDIIELRVGTRINEAHQDPRLPVELGIRRNLVRTLAACLRERYAKKVTLRFV